MTRDGYVARWRETEYEAVPGAGGDVRLYATAPVEGFEEVAPDRFRRVVQEGELDGLHYVRTRCSWRGHPFIVIGEHEGWLRLEYTGGRAPVAASLNLERVDFAVYQAWAQRTEVEELHEEAI